MKNGENAKLAFRWIGKRPVESFLLIVGIALGVGATGAGLTLYLHTQQETDRLINSTTYREIVISTREEAEEMELPAVPVNADEFATLTAEDLTVRNELQGVDYAFIANRTVFRIGKWGPPGGTDGGSDGMQSEIPETSGPAPSFDEIYGYEVTPEFFTANGHIPARGSLFTKEDIENSRRVMVLGSRLAETLFPDGVSLGREVTHRKQLYEITGTLEPTGTVSDTMAFVPAVIPDMARSDPRMARMFFMKNPFSLHFIIDDAGRLDEMKDHLMTNFEDKYGENTITVDLPREEAQSTISRNRRISIIILFLAVSGLLIAGVNVSNILLGRMMRSRKKIGVLKALGASKNSIFHLFAIEGFILSAGGAAAGTGVSYLIFTIMQNTLGLSGFNVLYLAVGIVFSWFITMIVTILPAVQAAKIPAADAIRHE